jgi:hypothetical protein
MWWLVIFTHPAHQIDPVPQLAKAQPMARIPDNEIDRLKDEVSVERVVGASGVALKKSGKDWLGRCTFHEDETASLVVTPGKNLWHCFGFGVAGGPIEWVMKSPRTNDRPRRSPDRGGPEHPEGARRWCAPAPCVRDCRH